MAEKSNTIAELNACNGKINMMNKFGAHFYTFLDISLPISFPYSFTITTKYPDP